jgi:hypothetical protein
VGRAAVRAGDRRAAAQAARGDPGGPALRVGIGIRYHDGEPGIVEGLLSRGDRRVGGVIEAVWRDGGRFDGWSEHFSYERWMRCAAEVFGELNADAWPGSCRRTGTPPASATAGRSLPWDHIDSGLDRDWLWDDWQEALEEAGQEDCRWTPCFNCGVCQELGTHIQVGPTGGSLRS